MKNNHGISRYALHAISLVLVIAALLLLGLALYQYTQTGTFSMMSIIIAVVCLLFAFVPRKGVKNKD